MKEILTERLILRNFVDSDAEGMLEYLSNPRAECFIDEKSPITMRQFKE
jgi:RimJ/RimL family protein N-acetyltransferase